MKPTADLGPGRPGRPDDVVPPRSERDRLRGGGPAETCTRTIQGYALLRPGPEEDELTLGVLGRALDYYQVELYAFAFASTHYHLLYGAESQLQVSRFQGYFNGKGYAPYCTSFLVG